MLLGGWVGIAVGLWLSVLAPVRAEARSACETPIRILIQRAANPVDLTVDGKKYRFKLHRGRELSVNGSKVGAWMSPMGEHRLGEVSLFGRVQVRAHQGEVVVIGHVPLDKYVEGTLKGEMPSRWAEEALRAQAVVSRTYALHERAMHAEAPYDVATTTQSQVYLGGGVAESIRRAVKDTDCRVLTHGGDPILAVFHSAAGGKTASSGEVWGRDLTYLVSQQVGGEDDSPDTYWRTQLSPSELRGLLASRGHRLGRVRGVRIVARSSSGRVKQIEISGSSGQIEISGGRFRTLLGNRRLRSTLFEVREDSRGDFVFVGSGRGHGVGMSQWGARAMAQRGVSYPQILSNFYPGTRLEKWRASALSSREVGSRSD